MQCVRILVVTGASGSDKTTLLRRIEARGIAGVSFHYFDSIGIPSTEQMVADCGSPSHWQAAITHQWIERLIRGESGLCVLDGQVRPSTAREALARYQIDGHVLLLDCSHAVREVRLRDGRQQKRRALDSIGMALYSAAQTLTQALERAGLDPHRLEPWEAWKVFKGWLVSGVDGSEYDAASVQISPATPDEAPALFLIRQFTRREGLDDALLGRVVVAFYFEAVKGSRLTDLAVWTHDFPTLAEFASVVEAQPSFQSAVATAPIDTDVYWDEDGDAGEDPE